MWNELTILWNDLTWNDVNEITGYRHAPSRLPMNKLKSLLQKTRKVTLFVWKSIRKNTPLSSEIHCYVKSRKGLHLNRYRSNCSSVRFLLKGQLQNQIDRKRGKVYLSSKHQSTGDLGGMRYPNRLLSKNLPLCTCNQGLCNNYQEGGGALKPEGGALS